MRIPKCAKADTVDLGAGFQFGRASCGPRPNSNSPKITQVVAGAVKRRPIPESADDYDRVVAVLNSHLRVIECRDRVQWVVQARNQAEAVSSSDWRGRSYCRTKEVLLRCWMPMQDRSIRPRPASSKNCQTVSVGVPYLQPSGWRHECPCSR